MSDDPVLYALYEAGFPIDLLLEEQRATLSELTPEEVTLLIDIKRRLDATAPEVTAHHGEVIGGVFF